MSGLSSLLGIAQSGLSANSYALNITGQNVSNVNTDGYSDEAVDFSTNLAGGVDASNVTRAFDQFSSARMIATQSSSSAATSRDDAMSSLQSLFSDTTGTGLGDSMSQLFSSFSALAANPSDTTTRNTVLSNADQFASEVRGVSGQIQAQRSDLLAQAQSTAGEVNTLTTQIAKLNQSIGSAQSSGADVSNLDDQRDELVSQLSQKIDVKALTDSTGQMTILSAGTALVTGQTAATLSVGTDASGNIQVKSSLAGSAGTDVTNRVAGGSLGGIITARDQDLAGVAKSLDTFTTDVATAVNTQFEAGYGSDGVNGRPLFQLTPGAGAAASLNLDPNMVGHPERVAAAGAATAEPGDADNATALGNFSSALVAEGGTKTATDGYADLVGNIGLTKQDTAQEASTQSTLFSQAKTMNDSASGVSLDEEMTKLSQFQRAYEANSKVLQTADTLMSDLMAITS